MSWEIGFDLGLPSFTTDASSMVPEKPPPKRRKTQLASDSRPKRVLSLEDHVLNKSGVPNWPVSSTIQGRSTIRMASTTAMRTSKGKFSDALATVSTCFNDRETLYGASSTISFVERVLLATGEPENFGGQSRFGANEARHEIHSVERFDSQVRQLSGLEVLPIRRISDSYVESFWEVSHTIFPILHRPTFTRFYNKLWAPTSLADTPEATNCPTMLAILNLVLAIGCRTAESVQHGSRALLSDQFYQRARELVPIDALDVASLPAVQMLLLTAVCLQSTTYSSRYWNIVALATRMAQSLGLHLNRSASGTSNQVEREMRRRIWYTCVALESEDDQAYAPTTGKHEERSMPDLHELLRLNSKLDRFLEALPRNLKLESVLQSSETPTGNVLLQARVLYFTFGAATVILASHLSSLRDDTAALANDSLSLAMEILKHYTPEVESATEAIQALENIRTSLSSGEKQGAELPHQEIKQIQKPNRSLHPDSEVVHVPGANSFEYGAQVQTPDPLGEEWFSCQALDFDFQDYIWENRGK
ncbi:hypothetical protein HG530_014872 [Fusarium avenaceum]|nr:hypothetical protein HG530_014872 [Fusarium avenaceum]